MQNKQIIITWSLCCPRAMNLPSIDGNQKRVDVKTCCWMRVKEELEEVGCLMGFEEVSQTRTTYSFVRGYF